MTDKLPEIMAKLRTDLGREPPATVTNIEDYAPKHDLKAEHITNGLREAMEELASIDVSQSKELDTQAQLLADIHNIIAKMKAR